MGIDASLKRIARIAKTWKTDPSVLLCPNIPKPMHGVAPREVMGTKWWNATRQASYKSTAYHCKACRVHKALAKARQWLEGHEVYKVNYAKGRMIYLRTEPLCHFCHNYIHDGRMLNLISQGRFRYSKYVSIIQHGDAVLTRAGLRRKTREEREEEMLELLVSGGVAPWKEWRLVFDGKEYPPKFKTEAQWRKANTKGK